MKYLKKFSEDLREEGITIEQWCKHYHINEYTIRDNGVVDTNSTVYAWNKMIQKLPIQFGIVTGTFWCSENVLNTLKGCPREVSGIFCCDNNKLTTLEYGPVIVGKKYSCENNNLITLNGSPENLDGEFHCTSNPIYEVFKIFGTLERYQASLDYKYWRGIDIISGRFKKACEDVEIKMPDSIKGYKYIDL
jgi:hypothetical protein